MMVKSWNATQARVYSMNPRLKNYLKIIFKPVLPVYHRLFQRVNPEPNLYLRYAAPGHHYSTIPAWEDLYENQARIFSREKQALPGIQIDDGNQLACLGQFARVYPGFTFPEEKQKGYRFFLDNGVYSRGDAVILYSVLRTFQTRKIVEVGAGSSSCLILDVNERYLQKSLQHTVIDPYPQRFLDMIDETDQVKFNLIDQRLQDIDLGIFESLGENDVAFFDSTHVSKCDSDVNHIIFNILPRLRPGVLIHFHDIFYPFEYIRSWLLEIGACWNEAYILRAFLEYNPAFEILFFSDYMGLFYPEACAEAIPEFMRGVGSSLWLRKV